MRVDEIESKLEFELRGLKVEVDEMYSAIHPGGNDHYFVKISDPNTKIEPFVLSIRVEGDEVMIAAIGNSIPCTAGVMWPAYYRHCINFAKNCGKGI